VRVLFDVVHPAHVHFCRYLITELEAAGHETRVVSRRKDVTTDLLDHYGIPHVVVGSAKRAGLIGLAGELARRDWALVRIAREFRPDVVVTRNPAGVQAARLAGARGVFDTDDGREVGIHFRAAAPFAHVITTPDCVADDFGRKHVKYPSYKALAFLHPSRFTPDPSVLDELGLAPDDRYFVVRFVAFAASHDRHAAGLAPDLKRSLVDRLGALGRVFVSSEAPLPPELELLALPTAPHRIHDALAFASLCVTDGQSMAGEAAVLGVPSVRFASSCGRLAVFRELATRYGLVFEFRPDEATDFLRTVEELASSDRSRWDESRRRLLEEKCDLTSWLLELLSTLPTRSARRSR
jgi:predicted glycosyltransferase